MTAPYLLLLGSLAAFGGMCSSATQPAQARVGGAVQDSIAAGRSVRVVVALRAPDAALDLEERRRAIRRLQDGVLASVSSTDFTLVARYATVPALSGTLHTRAGLDRLRVHPDVVRVDADVGGGGQPRSRDTSDTSTTAGARGRMAPHLPGAAGLLRF